MARSEQVRNQHPPSQYQFKKLVVTEEFGSDGNAKKRKEKTYQMVQIPGEPSAHQIEPKPSKRSKATKEEREFTLEDDLVQRFSFSIVGHEYVNRRPAIVIAFEAKPNLPAKSLQDRVINKVRGKAWVDEREFEIARLDISLAGDVSFVWGLLGNLRRFNLAIERIKLEDGVWLNRETSGVLEFRKLLSSKSIQWKESMSNFVKVNLTPEELDRLKE